MVSGERKGEEGVTDDSGSSVAVGHCGLVGWSWGRMEEGQLKGKSVLSRAFKIKLEPEGVWLQDSW